MAALLFLASLPFSFLPPFRIGSHLKERIGVRFQRKVLFHKEQKFSRVMEQILFFCGGGGGGGGGGGV